MSTKPTQVKRPWRATVRTVFQAAVAGVSLAPVIYAGATLHDPAQATGLAAQALVVCGGAARVMALPGVESWLQRFVPFLAAEKPTG